MIFGLHSTPIAFVEARNAQSKPVRTPFEALSEEAQVRLRELVASVDPLGKLIARARGTVVNTPDPTRHGPTRRDLRVPKPGDLLCREYKRKQIIVRVLERGFEHEGRRFRSLSAIAKCVTGAHWNGLLFFGLVRQER